MYIFSFPFRPSAVFAVAIVLGSLCSCSKDKPNSDEILPEETPAIILENQLTNKVFFEKGRTSDNYYMGLYTGNIELYTSEEGSIWIPSDADSRLLYLDLYAASGSSIDGIKLPAGTYTVADNTDGSSVYAKYTYGIWYFGKDVDYADVTSGTVKVEYTDVAYRITAEFEMVRSSDKTSAGKLKFRYEGALDFADHSLPDSEDLFPPLTDPVNTTFSGADIHYLGIPAYTSPVDVYVLDLYDDTTPLPGGVLDEGNVLRLELYTEHQGYFPGEKRLKMPAGTYTMTDGYVPMFVGIGSGNIWDSGYGFFPYGSYIRHMDDKSDKVFFGFIGETGSVKVETDGNTTYTITVNLTTREGVSVKGTYTGSVTISNEAQEPERQQQSRIYEDKVLNLAKTTSADVDFGGTSQNAATNFYHIFAQDPTSRQGFQLELLTPVTEKMGSIAGTYKPSEVLLPSKMVPYTYIPGDIKLVPGGAAMVGTWGYYEENAAGKATAFAPAIAGNIVVTESAGPAGKTLYTINYVLTDDNLETPHTMTAKFEGTFNITDKSQVTSAQPAAMFSAPKSRQVPVKKPEARRFKVSNNQKAVRF